MTTPRLSVCLTFDFDALSPWAHEMALGNMAAMSRGEFGAVAIPRILALLDRHEVPRRSSFPVTPHSPIRSSCARFAMPATRSATTASSTSRSRGSARAERAILQRGLDALDQVAGVRPLGYRAPNVDVSVNTVDILLEHGFQYDASFSGSDFEPYYLRHGDRFPPDGAYEFGETVDLVGIPFSWGLSDFQYFEFVPGITVRQDPPSAVYEIWNGELQWAHAHVPGGVYDLTMHPQAIGRGHRLVMVERLISAAKALDGVAFERLGDYAARWRREHPLAEWLREQARTSTRATSANTIARMERLAQLARIGGSSSGGVTRSGLGRDEQHACELVASWMAEDGLEVSWDAAGNLFGRRRGTDPAAPEVWSGSHLDSVPEGGRFDGSLGVLLALEAAAAARARAAARDARRVRLPRRGGLPLRARDVRQPRRLRAAVRGRPRPHRCRGDDRAGRALGARLHGAPRAALASARQLRRGARRAGPGARARDVPLPAVTAITGMAGFDVRFHGESGHAGTLPMAGRRDAFLAAAAFALALRDEALRLGNAVATVGDVRIIGGAANVVPAGSRPRSTCARRHWRRSPRSRGAAPRLAREVGFEVDIEQVTFDPPVPLSARVQDALRAAARAEGARSSTSARVRVTTRASSPRPGWMRACSSSAAATAASATGPRS